MTLKIMLAFIEMHFKKIVPHEVPLNENFFAQNYANNPQKRKKKNNNNIEVG